MSGDARGDLDPCACTASGRPTHLNWHLLACQSVDEGVCVWVCTLGLRVKYVYTGSVSFTCSCYADICVTCMSKEFVYMQAQALTHSVDTVMVSLVLQ